MNMSAGTFFYSFLASKKASLKLETSTRMTVQSRQTLKFYLFIFHIPFQVAVIAALKTRFGSPQQRP